MYQNTTIAGDPMRLYEKLIRFMLPTYMPGPDEIKFTLAQRVRQIKNSGEEDLEDISDRIKRQQPEVDHLLKSTKIQYINFIDRGKVLDGLVQEIKDGNKRQVSE